MLSVCKWGCKISMSILICDLPYWGLSESHGKKVTFFFFTVKDLMILMRILIHVHHFLRSTWMETTQNQNFLQNNHHHPRSAGPLMIGYDDKKNLNDKFLKWSKDWWNYQKGCDILHLLVFKNFLAQQK